LDIPLKTPIEVEGRTFTSLDFDPTLEQLETFELAMAATASEPAAEQAALTALIAAACDVPAALVRKLRLSDMKRMMEAAALGDGPLPPRSAEASPGAPPSPTSPTS
jgi:hypothetical protein